MACWKEIWQLHAAVWAVLLKQVSGAWFKFNGSPNVPWARAGRSEGVGIGVASNVIVTVGTLSWKLQGQ